MADELTIALLDLLRKAQLDDNADFLRDRLRTVSQALMEASCLPSLAPTATSAPPNAPATGMATVSASGTLALAPSSSKSRACGMVAVVGVTWRQVDPRRCASAPPRRSRRRRRRCR